MADRTRFTDRTRETFLATLGQTSSVTESAKAAGFSRRTAYDHREADPDFARAWDEAVDIATDALEREARRRAYEGYEGKPITYKGQIVARITEYSDRMLELLLRAHRPDKYREVVKSESHVKYENVTDRPLKSYTPDELRKLLEFMESEEAQAE